MSNDSKKPLNELVHDARAPLNRISIECGADKAGARKRYAQRESTRCAK